MSWSYLNKLIDGCYLLIELCCADVDWCRSSPCRNGGSCASSSAGYTCTCTSGFSGAQCQTGTWHKPSTGVAPALVVRALNFKDDRANAATALVVRALIGALFEHDI